MSAHKIKIVHTENALDVTGGFKALYDYILSEKDQVNSVVVVPKGSKCKKILEDQGITTYEIPFLEINRNVFHLLFYIPCLLINGWRINRIVRKEKADVLHSNDLYNLSLHVVKYIFRYNKPLVVHVRLMPASYPGVIYRFWKRIHLRLADALVAVSEAVKKEYGESEKLHTVYDVANLSESHAPYRYSYNSESHRTFNFLYLANFTVGKGQDFALEAFAKLNTDSIKATLTFVGGDFGKTPNIRFRETLMLKSSAYGLASRVFFEGFTSDAEEKMKQFDAILNFSIAESFSFTSFDTLRYGIPLIVSDCGGPAELFENGKSGILVRNANVEDMTKAMKQLIENPSTGELFSLHAKQYIQDLMKRSHRFDYLTSLFISLNDNQYDRAN